MEAALQSGDEQAIAKALSSLTDQATSSSAPDPFPDGAALCTQLLSCLKDHPGLSARVAELLAALARKASFRDVAAACPVIPSIVPILVPLTAFFTNDTILHALRAVGNLCIDHDQSRRQFMSAGGLGVVSGLVGAYAEMPLDPATEEIKYVLCVCVVNICCDGEASEEICKELIGHGALMFLGNLLSEPGQPQKVLKMAIELTNILVDSCGPEDLESLAESPLTLAIVQLLQTDSNNSPEVTAVLFQLLETLVENKRWKAMFVECGAVQLLLNMSSTEVRQKAIDLVALVAGDDERSNELFKDDEFVSKVLELVASPSNEPLIRGSAAILLSNLARTDSNCTTLVERGVIPLLISLIKHEGLPEEVRDKVCFAALGTLKNLALPEAHKLLFLREGVAEAATDILVKSSAAHVHFKALGLLRFLSLKQEVCLFIVSKPKVVERIAKVADEAGFPHIKLEGARLLASIVKHCKDSDVMQQVVQEAGLRWATPLLGSEHELLRNEAIVSLSILAAIHSDFVEKSVEETEVVTHLLAAMSEEKSSQILTNCVTLVENLLFSKEGSPSPLVFQRHKAPVEECLSKLLASDCCDSELLKTKIKELLERLDAN